MYYIKQYHTLIVMFMICIFSANNAYTQGLINIEEEKVLYLGPNLIDSCSITFNSDCWDYNKGVLERKTSTDMSPFVFNVATKKGEDYYFQVVQDDGTLTNAFHVGIGDCTPTDPYNLTSKMSVLVRSDGGELKIVPQSGEYFKLSSIRFSEILDTASADSARLMQNSVAIGNTQSSVGGKWNVAIGDRTTMANNLNASRSIAIGHNAMTYLESGIQNIGVGTFALYEMQYGERNIGLGPDALYRTRNAFDNVAIGRGVLANEKFSMQDITLERNVGIGNFAMIRNHENTHDAVAIGYFSNAECGDEDVSIGNHANQLGGAKNVIIGYEAGKSNGRDENVIIGYKAVPGEIGKGRGDVIIGAYADIAGPVNNSIIIGKDSQISFAENSIVIGNSAVCNKSNQTVIGNVSTTEAIIHGDLVIRGSDGRYRQIVFHDNGYCTWEYVGEIETSTPSVRSDANKKDVMAQGIYDLSGKTINKITLSGIYIVNGEKMYVRPIK